MRSGVYRLRVGPWSYYGQAADLIRRSRSHLRDLRGNRHHNQILQRAFSKHGEDSFSFDVLCECEPGLLDEVEIAWIGIGRMCGRCANMNDGGGTQRGAVLSRETKEKIARALRGRKLSKRRRAMSSCPGESNPRSVLTEKQVRVICWAIKFGCPPYYLSRAFGMKSNVAGRIKNGKLWKHVASEILCER